MLRELLLQLCLKGHSVHCSPLLHSQSFIEYTTSESVHLLLLFLLLFFFKRFYLFLDRGEGREKEGGRETSICGCLSHAPYWRPGLETQACALTGSPPDDPWARRQALNPLSHTSQGSPSSSELSFFSAFCTFILLRIYKIPIIS